MVPGHFVCDECGRQALDLLLLLLLRLMALQQLSSIRAAAAEGRGAACRCPLPLLEPVATAGLVGHLVSRQVCLVSAAVPAGPKKQAFFVSFGCCCYDLNCARTRGRGCLPPGCSVAALVTVLSTHSDALSSDLRVALASSAWSGTLPVCLLLPFMGTGTVVQPGQYPVCCATTAVGQAGLARQSCSMLCDRFKQHLPVYPGMPMSLL